MHVPWQAQYQRHLFRALRRVAFWSGKMILRGRCSTSYDLASLFFSWQAQYFLGRWSGTNAKRNGRSPPALY